MKIFSLWILLPSFFWAFSGSAFGQACLLSQQYALNGTGNYDTGSTVMDPLSEAEVSSCQMTTMICGLYFAQGGSQPCSIQNSPGFGIGNCWYGPWSPVPAQVGGTTPVTLGSFRSDIDASMAAGNAAEWGSPGSGTQINIDHISCFAYPAFAIPSGYFKDDLNKKKECTQVSLGSKVKGSIIDCRDQTLTQEVPISGTPFKMVYSAESTRQMNYPDRTFTYVLPYWNHPLMNGNSWQLSGARVVFNIAGQTHTQSITANDFANVIGGRWEAPFTWDGKDQNGNWVQGVAQGEATAYYDYVEGWTSAATDLHQVKKVVLMGQFLDPGRTMGWSLDIHHSYNVGLQMVTLGSGMVVKNTTETTYNLDGNGNYNIPSSDGSEIYQFSSVGRHLKTINTLTGVTLYTFQYSSNLLSSITNRDGLVTLIHRDSSNRIDEIESPYNKSTLITYDTDNNITSIENPLGATNSFTYHTGTLSGMMASMTDPLNKTKTYDYDSEGNLNGATDAKNGTKSLSSSFNSGNGYHQKIATFTSPGGLISEFKSTFYTSGSSVQENVYPSGFTEYNNISADGKTKSISNSFGQSVNTTVKTHPLFAGREIPFSTADEYSSTTSTIHNYTLGTPGAPLTLTDYAATTDVDGNIYTTNYDRSTKTLVKSTPVGRTTTTVLNSKGRPTSVSYPGMLGFTYTYDTDGQVATVTQGTRVTTLNYNSAGLLSSVENPLSQTTSFTYDAAGQVTGITLPNTKTYGFTYNLNGDTSSLTNAGSETYSFTFDNNRNLELNTEPTISSINYVWDYDYNADDQVTQIAQPDASNITYTYNTQGLVDTVTGTNLSRSYSYSSTGFLQTITSATNQTLSFAASSKPDLTTWGGDVSGTVGYTWAYSNRNRLSALKVNGSTVLNFSYNADDEITQLEDFYLTRNSTTGLLTATSQSTVSTANTYTTYGELDTVSVDNNGTSLVSFDYDYDALGRISQMDKTVGSTTTTTSYTYDSVGQLSTETTGSVTKTYTYTDNGNRLTTLGYEVYDDQDRLTSNALWDYTYNKNGHLSRKDHVSNGSYVIYTYDDFGNLLEYEHSNGTVVTYQIDGLDRRIQRKLNNTFTDGFLYQDKLRPIAQLNSDGSVRSIFAYGSKENVPDFMIQGTTKYRIISDYRGSPLYVIDTSTNLITQAMTYDSWGNVLTDTNPGFQPFGFAGGLYDVTTGLVRFGARDYDASIGRWLNKDPIRHDDGMNLYAYTHNDPINFIDLDGLQVRFADETARQLYNNLVANMKSNTKLKTILKLINEKNDVLISVVPDSDSRLHAGNDSGDARCMETRTGTQEIIVSASWANPDNPAHQALLLHELVHSWQISMGQKNGPDGQLSNILPNFIQRSFERRFDK